MSAAASNVHLLPDICQPNPFKLNLEQGKVKMLQKPISRNSCGGEWRRFGLCCNPKDLEDYAKKDREDILSAAEAVTSTFIRFKNSYRRIISIGSIISAAEVASLDANKKAVVKFIQSNESRKFHEQMQALLAEERMAKASETCWTRIATSRSNTLCSVCSGRSDRFFEGDKILMSQSDCNAILQECAPSFQSTVQILEALGGFFESFERSTEKFCPRWKQQIDYFESLLKKITQANVHVEFRKYLEQEEGQSKNKTATSLCSKFLNMQGFTFVEKAKRILIGLNLKHLATFMNFTFEAVSKMRQQTSFAVSGRHTGTRLLNENGSIFNMQTETRSDADNPTGPASESTSSNSAGSVWMDPTQLVDSLFFGDVMISEDCPEESYTPGSEDSRKDFIRIIRKIPVNLTSLFP